MTSSRNDLCEQRDAGIEQTSARTTGHVGKLRMSLWSASESLVQGGDVSGAVYEEVGAVLLCTLF